MKSIIKNYYILLFVLMSAPMAVFAAGGINGVLTLVGGIVAKVIPIIIAIGVVMFLWGVLKYVTAKDAEGHKEAMNVMISGIVVLFVMVSIWGLVNLLGETLGLVGEAPPPPQLPGF